MSDPEEARLARDLTRLFGLLRPRAGYEVELWRRLQSGRSRRTPGRLWAPAAVAVLLVLALPAGALLIPKLGASQLGSFGRLPAPALADVPGFGLSITGGPVAYFGPAELSVSAASLPKPVSALPVYQYREPTVSALGDFAKGHGPGVAMGSGETGREPLYAWIPDSENDSSPGALSSLSAQTAAETYLAVHGLLPSWVAQVKVDVAAGSAVVHFIRQFQVPGFGPAGEVDKTGEAAGADVLVRSGGTVAGATVPLPTPLKPASYEARTRARSILDALNDSSASASGKPAPSVVLDHSRLVYVPVPDGQIGFFEPAWLFTGSFQRGGVSYQKRVLVPALDSSQLR